MFYEPNICLFTIPHSGTRFTMNYFQHLNWHSWNPNKSTNNFTYWQQHSGAWIDQAPQDHRDLLTHKKIIVTVQHPHRCWISFLTRNKTFDMNVYCWKSLLDWLPRLDYILFDINCPIKKRKDQLINILKHTEKYTKTNEQLTEQFVNENWIPAYPKDSQYKQSYLQAGKLPSGYDYTQLDFAVEWYESLPSNNY